MESYNESSTLYKEYWCGDWHPDWMREQYSRFTLVIKTFKKGDRTVMLVASGKLMGTYFVLIDQLYFIFGT